MSNLGLNGVSFVALMIALVAMGIALLRARRSPLVMESRERALERRVDELENTVKTLQQLLYEKERQNGQLKDEVARLSTRVKELERMAPVKPAEPEPEEQKRPNMLYVLTGNDPALRIDLSVLREVEQHGWRVSRIYPPTMAKLKSVLDRNRASDRPVRNLHLALHSGPRGLEFADGLATGAWLSETLKNVQVLLLNGCANDEVGDWIGSVPFVVTMREEVVNEEAAQFARLFWVGIASGLAAEDAFYAARDRSPQAVGEFVELVG